MNLMQGKTDLLPRLTDSMFPATIIPLWRVETKLYVWYIETAYGLHSCLDEEMKLILKRRRISNLLVKNYSLLLLMMT